MKKLVLMFVAIAAISFASCGNNAKPEATEEEVIEDTVAVVDSTDTTAVEVEEAAAEEAAPAEAAAE